MKSFTYSMCAILAVMFIVVPLAAQDRGSGDRGTPGAAAPSTSSIASRGIATSTVTSTPSVSSSRDYASGSPSYSGSSRSGGSGGSYYAPNLQGTSFYSVDSYYLWETFRWRMLSQYNLNPYYFSRFSRNSEPLVTPELLKLVTREPIRLTSRMLAAIDELETMLNDREAGKEISKQALASKSQEIRELAKQIRQNETLNYVDLRKEKNVLKEDHIDVLNTEAISKLRNMALDLSRQLKYLYNLSTTSTVGANTFNEPSLTSLAKGIEKLSKAIENSSKRL
jgi:hypothetical protein